VGELHSAGALFQGSASGKVAPQSQADFACADLTSSSATMTMQVLNAVAQFERDLLIERTQSGLRRAKFEGKTLGRPSILSDEQKQDVREDIANGLSVSAIARKFGTSRQTIMRVREDGSRSVRS
jgi:putative DNA-invertase from lambdoid prophage Rac